MGTRRKKWGRSEKHQGALKNKLSKSQGAVPSPAPLPGILAHCHWFPVGFRKNKGDFSSGSRKWFWRISAEMRQL